MISTIITDPVKDEGKGFPKLMKGFDVVVLFISERYGTVVYREKNAFGGTPLGYWDDTWYSDQFTDFHGTILLRNEE